VLEAKPRGKRVLIQMTFDVMLNLLWMYPEGQAADRVQSPAKFVGPILIGRGKAIFRRPWLNAKLRVFVTQIARESEARGSSNATLKRRTRQ
jgi:hypothetical protein